MIDKILHILKNKNNKIEGQRLNRKWFLKNNYLEEWSYLSDNNIHRVQDLYDFINHTSNICTEEKCTNIRRFKGFYLGYVDKCEKCSRKQQNKSPNINNYTSLDLDINEIKKYIDECKDKNGNYSSSKLIKSKKMVQMIYNKTNFLEISAPLKERIYIIMNNLTRRPRCKCGNEISRFESNNTGYYHECRKCGIKKKDYTKSLDKLFEYYINKHIDDSNLLKLFSKKDFINNRLDTLIHYKCTKCLHKYNLPVGYQGRFRCPKCYNTRSNSQYDVFDLISKYDKSARYNDRKLLSPKELDIYSEKYNFAIEYDGINFHSFGKSSYNPLNNYKEEDKNCHLEKTILCENKNIQLLRIFSNEWLDSNKRNIWKSMIMNKMNLSNRIYARKCSIQELKSKVSNEFLDNNHMQGGCRASIKIGLFYENELVQVMTLGKPRFNKKYEYEIIRIAGKLGTSVIGGASKMLKYFERNYKPKSIISYANRRWSKGNVYKQLGFELSHISVPNYFYFKGGDDSILMSRNKFQKHKLNNLLDNFNYKNTETENMYNNGYRKIYDCGNLVYIKEYIK